MIFAVTIFPDISLLSVIVVFIILFIALDKILFQPLFRVMEERAKRTDGVMAESTKMAERHTALLNQYEQSIRAARSESYKMQEQTRSEAVRQGTEVIHQSRGQAEELIQKAKRELQGQVEEAKTALASDAAATAVLIEQTILQRPVGPADRKGQPS